MFHLSYSDFYGLFYYTTQLSQRIVCEMIYFQNEKIVICMIID